MMLKYFMLVLLGSLMVLLGAGSAFAALNTAGWAVDVGPVEIVVGLIAVAYLGIWGFKKLVKFLNRS